MLPRSTENANGAVGGTLCVIGLTDPIETTSIWRKFDYVNNLTISGKYTSFLEIKNNYGRTINRCFQLWFVVKLFPQKRKRKFEKKWHWNANTFKEPRSIGLKDTFRRLKHLCLTIYLVWSNERISDWKQETVFQSQLSLLDSRHEKIPFDRRFDLWLSEEISAHIDSA